jgi:methionyl-tRNA formyltransferase
VRDDAEAGDRLRIAFMGTPEAAVPTLRAVAGAGHRVVLVITRPDRPRGRGKELTSCPVKLAALELGLPVAEPEDVNAPESVDRLAESKPDVLLVVAYGRILKKRVFTTPRLLPMNLHFSMLPEYRGAAPVERAIAEGRTRTGVTLQRLAAKLDAGPVLAGEEVEIGPDETTAELEARLAVIGAGLVVRTLPALARGEVEEVPQDPTRVSYAPMLAKSDGRVDFTRDAEALRCHVRAMNPWPGAQATFAPARGGRPRPVILLRARAAPAPDPDTDPGEVISITDQALVVATGRGRLEIRELKPAGKRAMSAREFANGYHTRPGDRFV